MGRLDGTTSRIIVAFGFRNVRTKVVRYCARRPMGQCPIPKVLCPAKWGDVPVKRGQVLPSYYSEISCSAGLCFSAKPAN